MNVVACPVPAVDYAGTSFGPHAAPATLQLPASLELPGDAQVFGAMVLPTETAYLVGPKSAACNGFMGGDGSASMTTASVSDPSERVAMTLSPGGLGPNIDLACPYIPAVRDADEAFRQGTDDAICTQPSGDVIRQIPTGTPGLYAAAVLVPAGVNDPNIQDSPDPDPAVMLYTVQLAQSGGASGQEIACTLAPAQADVCAASLKFFLGTQAQISTLVTAANLTTMQAALSSFLADEGF